MRRRSGFVLFRSIAEQLPQLMHLCYQLSLPTTVQRQPLTELSAVQIPVSAVHLRDSQPLHVWRNVQFGRGIHRKAGFIHFACIQVSLHLLVQLLALGLLHPVHHSNMESHMLRSLHFTCFRHSC
eukprot:TRINITY_DN9566_c0_g2_i1.p4 TRINITY_DN9566_c0_g2~~TRINITY_DN9566_c0_g2_i1.p4  ORF type:complete len:125 (-),score=8.09 TRINITY_DN9566_c0_g2_i1:435-809(-)